MPTKAQLEQQVADLQAEIENNKNRVRDLAYKVAEEQGWCNPGVADALAELDIKPRIRTFEGNLVFDLPVTIEFYDTEEDLLNWVHACLSDKPQLIRMISDLVVENFDDDVHKVRFQYRPTINVIDNEGNNNERPVVLD